MADSAGISTGTAPPQRADRLAVVGLVAAVLAVAILLFTFRSLVWVTLPLAVIAVVLGIWSAVSAARPSGRTLGVVALVLGLLALIVSAAALAVELNVEGGYDFYERRRP